MLCYDVSDRRSFDAMWKFYRQVVDAKGNLEPSKIPFILVGNMVDTVTR
jgi:GTPase SAR1 family protein